MLTISSNRRFIVREDGAPFFYLGDTAWELFHRLTLSEAELYLRDRAAKQTSEHQGHPARSAELHHSSNKSRPVTLPKTC